jgi:hypothetical protein
VEDSEMALLLQALAPLASPSVRHRAFKFDDVFRLCRDGKLFEWVVVGDDRSGRAGASLGKLLVRFEGRPQAAFHRDGQVQAAALHGERRRDGGGVSAVILAFMACVVLVLSFVKCLILLERAGADVIAFVLAGVFVFLLSSLIFLIYLACIGALQ